MVIGRTARFHNNFRRLITTTVLDLTGANERPIIHMNFDGRDHHMRIEPDTKVSVKGDSLTIEPGWSHGRITIGPAPHR
jgi:hypothetical protein